MAGVLPRQVSGWQGSTAFAMDPKETELCTPEFRGSISTEFSEHGVYMSEGGAASSATLASTSDLEVNLKLKRSTTPDIDVVGLQVDTRRLWDEIHHTARWGAIPDSLGMSRLTLSAEDKEVRDYFVYEALNTGCDVHTDKMGNIFAVLPGENNDLPPIGIGSHLDTQPAGGRFDGILGVLGALEVIRTIKASGIKTYAPIAAINWTNEEGARFTPGCTGSAVWADHIPIERAHGLYDDKTDCTFGQELKRIGYLGETPASYLASPLSAHFELHIEQRSRLEEASKKIGVVQGVQGIRWYEINIDGERAHAGSAMEDRGDSLVQASKVIVFLQAEAMKVSALATVGTMDLDAPSLNTVPGAATFTIDLRHPSESVLNELEATIDAYLSKLEAANDKIQPYMKRVWRSPAVSMNPITMSCVRKAAAKVVGDSTMDLLSLAGHDSALVAMRVPTSMIFVPSRDGISHSPLEYTNEEDCGTGVQVLLDAVLEYDSILRNNDRADQDSVVS